MTRRERILATLTDPYRVTSHGPNEWSAEALRNVFYLRPFFAIARDKINGTISSAYRSKDINDKVGGAKSSRHLRGLACDIEPGAGWVPSSAALTLWDLALRGELWLVQQIIIEPGWVHVGWYSYDEPDLGMRLMRKIKGGYETLKSRSPAE
jgi:hypothetical protein